MKIVILGSPQAGQQELFSLLANIPLDTIRQKPMEAQPGVCTVRDPRVTKLIQMYKPEKTAYAKIEFDLLPDFGMQGNTKTLIFNELKNSDEICWITKYDGAEADVPNFISELVIYDLMLVEKRLETIAKEQKKKFADAKEKEAALMSMCKDQLDAGKPLRELSFTDEQLKEMRPYQFFTLKPTVLVINVPEDRINDASITKKIREEFKYPCIQLNAELEEQINELKPEERGEFMKELGIDEPAIDKITRLVYEGLGYISFFTVGTDEVKAWTTRRNSTAPEAGSSIHSDIQRGFVRAEMMKYADLISLGSELKVKEAGKFHLKGKDYIVEDGDILSFLFNV